jgi:hypothetical protein
VRCQTDLACNISLIRRLIGRLAFGTLRCGLFGVAEFITALVIDLMKFWTAISILL